MSLQNALESRAQSCCELCAATEKLSAYTVPPRTGDALDDHVLVCSICREQIEDPEKVEVHHWRCLNDSMWSQSAAVQVVVWRMLQRLNSENWAQDALDIMYLDEETKVWAQLAGESEDSSDDKHIDSNGAQLAVGDTVTLTKDLNVKGTSFTAKRGTAVRGISLVAGNTGHIEGRVNGQQIVILTKFVKKA